MKLEDLRQGQRVRITFDAMVREEGGLYAHVTALGGGTPLPVPGSAIVSIELIEPKYVDGSFYQDAGGRVWQYRQDYSSKWLLGGSAIVLGSFPEMPLKRLVLTRCD